MRFFLSSFFLFLIVNFPAFSEFNLKAFKVGNGNCVLVRINDGKEYKNMVVDCGALQTDYKNAWKVPENVEEFSTLSSENSSSSPKKKSVSKEGVQKLIPPLQEKIFNNIKIFFGKDEKILIKTLFITHPDKDHYGWLNYVFSPKKFKIENIVLSGRPEKYMRAKMQDHSTTFKMWLTAHRENNFNDTPKTKIYFLALEGFDLDKFMDGEQLEDKFTALENKEYGLAPHVFSNPNNLNDLLNLGNALEFGDQTRISLLSVNPRHETVLSQSENPEVIKYKFGKSDEEDADNLDSLVIKIENIKTKESAILMGDANVATTQKIIINYSSNLEFLKTNLLLASHHGAESYGTNNLEWINLTQPEYVFLSVGLHYYHPKEATYEVLKKSPRLKLHVNKHEIMFGTSDKRFLKGDTYKGIFSTLTNGDLEARFLDKNMDENKNKDTSKFKILCHVHNKENFSKELQIETFSSPVVSSLEDKDEVNLDNTIFVEGDKEISHRKLLDIIDEINLPFSFELDLNDEGLKFLTDYVNFLLKKTELLDEPFQAYFEKVSKELSGVVKFKNLPLKLPPNHDYIINFNDPRNIPVIKQIKQAYWKHKEALKTIKNSIADGNGIIKLKAEDLDPSFLMELRTRVSEENYYLSVRSKKSDLLEKKEGEEKLIATIGTSSMQEEKTNSNLTSPIELESFNTINQKLVKRILENIEDNTIKLENKEIGKKLKIPTYNRKNLNLFIFYLRDNYKNATNILMKLNPYLKKEHKRKITPPHLGQIANPHFGNQDYTWVWNALRVVYEEDFYKWAETQ